MLMTKPEALKNFLGLVFLQRPPQTSGRVFKNPDTCTNIVKYVIWYN